MQEHLSPSPHAVRRLCSALLVASASVWALASCGGSGRGATAASDTIARVGTHPITRASLEHWMSVLVVTDDNDIPKKLDPRRAVPEPPSYVTCVSNAKATLKTTSRTQIKQKCTLLHQALQEQALEHLISTQQLYGESAERKITVSDDQVTKRLEALKRAQFPSPGAFESYLRITGQTIQDQLEGVRFNLLTAKLTQSLTGGALLNHLTLQQRARLASFAHTSKKWKDITTCEQGYIVPLCSNGDSTKNRPIPNILIAELGL